MPEGLLAAQVAHMTDQFMRKRIAEGKEFTDVEKAWMTEPYLSVLAVNTYEELMIIKDKAENEGLAVHMWKDVIPSEVLEGQFITCDVGLSIGPDDADAIKLVCGTLPRY